MGWAIGFDITWNRDIGYGVPAICDRPECGTGIDRGLAHVCGGEPYGGEGGCGLYFCEGDLTGPEQLCERCEAGEQPFTPTPDTAEWLNWKLTDESWERWRRENPEQVEHIRALARTKAD